MGAGCDSERTFHRVMPGSARRSRTCDFVAAMTAKGISDETGLDSIDFSKAGLRDAVHLRRIIVARATLSKAEEELREAVAASRNAGDSWTLISFALGASKQAAYQRFGRPATADVEGMTGIEPA